MEVIIDKVLYAPVNYHFSKVGISISTRNRHNVLPRAIEHHLKFPPAGALVVIIDYGSAKAVTVAEQNQRVKEKRDKLQQDMQQESRLTKHRFKP